jgi:hypothetical protein
MLFAIVSGTFEDLDGTIENHKPVNIALATNEEVGGLRDNFFVAIASQALKQSGGENWVEDASGLDASGLRAARICFGKGQRGCHDALRRKIAVMGSGTPLRAPRDLERPSS